MHYPVHDVFLYSNCMSRDRAWEQPIEVDGYGILQSSFITYYSRRPLELVGAVGVSMPNAIDQTRQCGGSPTVIISRFMSRLPRPDASQPPPTPRCATPVCNDTDVVGNVHRRRRGQGRRPLARSIRRLPAQVSLDEHCELYVLWRRRSAAKNTQAHSARDLLQTN